VNGSYMIQDSIKIRIFFGYYLCWCL